MKHLFFSVMIVLGNVALADQVLLPSPNPTSIWSAQIVDSHETLERTSCVAEVKAYSSQGRPFTLQVARLKQNIGFSEPTVLAIMGPVNQEFHVGYMKIDGAAPAPMLRGERVISSGATRVMGIAKIDDRQKLTAALISGNKAQLLLFKNTPGLGNHQVEEVVFSLKGSSAAIQKISSNCGG